MLAITRTRPALVRTSPADAQQSPGIESPGPEQPSDGSRQALPRCRWVSVVSEDGRPSLACRWMDADDVG